MLFVRTCLLAISLLLAAACQQAPAHPSPEPPVSETSQLSQAATLAATCSGCHAGPGTGVPNLDQMDAGTLSVRLAFYKAETDGTTVMHRIARGYSQAQLEAISQYLGMEASDE